MSATIPAVLLVDREGMIASQNLAAQVLVGRAKGRMCWQTVGTLATCPHLPCAGDCVQRLLGRGLEGVQPTYVTIAGQRHEMTCVPADNHVVCTLRHATGKTPDGWEALTRREREVLGHLACGDTTTSIANSLGVSEATVRTHVEKMRLKLGVATRAALVAKGFQLGYLD